MPLARSRLPTAAGDDGGLPSACTRVPKFVERFGLTRAQRGAEPQSVAICDRLRYPRCMSPAPSARLDEDLYTDAAAAGRVASRSTAQQLSYWARIGRAVAQGASAKQIVELLTAPYDELDGASQAIVRAEWSEQIARRASQNYAARFAAAGVAYSELDDGGNVVTHRPTPPGTAPAKLFPEDVAAYFVAAYGRDVVVGSDEALSRARYDQWRVDHPDAPSSAAITAQFKKTWLALPWKSLRALAEKAST